MTWWGAEKEGGEGDLLILMPNKPNIFKAFGFVKGLRIRLHSVASNLIVAVTSYFIG